MSEPIKTGKINYQLYTGEDLRTLLTSPLK